MTPGDGTGSGSGSDMMPGGGTSTARRITLTIPAAKVTSDLQDFPVYVEVTNDDLRTALDPAKMSFRQRNGGTVSSLAYEVQAFDKPQGRLQAWVRLPLVSATAATTFELQYGDAAVAVAADANAVWSNHYVAVFHLESKTNPIVDSSRNSPGTAMNLDDNQLGNGRLGRAIDFANDNGAVISFSNPITGPGPSTISAWISQRNTNGKDAVVVLGTGAATQARALHAEYDNNQIGIGLSDIDEWSNTGRTVQTAGWKLLHWTYDAAQSYLYLDGTQSAGPFVHTQAAATAGTGAWLGNVKGPNFDQNAALNGALDEVRISDVARSAAWMAAEFANQSAPQTFMTASAPQALP